MQDENVDRFYAILLKQLLDPNKRDFIFFLLFLSAVKASCVLLYFIFTGAFMCSCV